MFLLRHNIRTPEQNPGRRSTSGFGRKTKVCPKRAWMLLRDREARLPALPALPFLRPAQLGVTPVGAPHLLKGWLLRLHSD